MRCLALLVLSAVALPTLAAPADEAPRRPVARTRVAVLELRPIGVDAGVAELLSEVALTETASMPHLAVIGRSDIQAILGFEHQRRLLGCEEDTACLAEIGGALGVRLVLVGSVGKIGALYRLDLKVIEAGRADTARRRGVNVEGAEEKMVAAVQGMVRELLAPEARAAGWVAPAAAPGPHAAPPLPPLVTPPRSWLLGLRIGYARPGGRFERGVDQADWVGGQAAFQLEALYRLRPSLAVGAYAGYGAAEAGDAWSASCDELALKCSTSVVRLGLDATYELGGPAAGVIPWVGAGLGVELLSFTLEGVVTSEKGTASATALEPLHLQGGLDLRFGALRLGPYAMFGLARYGAAELDFRDFEGGERSTSLDAAFHWYAYLGLRAVAEL